MEDVAGAAMEDAAVVAMLAAMAAEEESLVLLTMERSKVASTSIRGSNFLGQRVWRSNIARTGCASIDSALTHTGNAIRFIRS